MKLLFFLFCIFTQLYSLAQPLPLHPQPITLKKDFRFRLTYQRLPYSRSGGRLAAAPLFAEAPDGRLFITDMKDRTDNHKGRVLILSGWVEGDKKFSRIQTYLSGLHNPNQVAFYSANDKHYLYVAETGKLSYYTYNAGDTAPSSPPKIIATFPAYGLDYKYGGWHLTRSLAFKNNKLYVSVGSSCNACIEKENERASVIEMNPDGSSQTVWARGLRNSVGLMWVGPQLYVTTMGRDGIGPDKPEDLLMPVKQGGYYGWPFYNQYKAAVYADGQFKDSARAAFVTPPPVAPWGFKAHSAPLGFSYFSGFADPLLNNHFMVALHGSTSVWRQRGNAVVQLLPGGRYQDVVSGFLQGKTEDKRYGRPADVAQWAATSFFISDDKNGVIYYVWKE